jgi:hypothetical protein
MKSKKLTLISLLVLFGLSSLILFLTVPDERLDSTVFWISFAFAIPLNLLCLCGFTVWATSQGGSALAKSTVSAYTSGAFAILLLAVGFIFMYLPFEGLTLPIIIYAVILAAYLIITLFVTSGAKYISEVEKPPLYIKMLEADVRDCAEKAMRPDVKAALLTFADNVRFSDPVSHPSLTQAEITLKNAVFEISVLLSANPEADVTEKIKAAEGMLAGRNNRCLILKQCSK